MIDCEIKRRWKTVKELKRDKVNCNMLWPYWGRPIKEYHYYSRDTYKTIVATTMIDDNKEDIEEDIIDFFLSISIPLGIEME